MPKVCGRRLYFYAEDRQWLQQQQHILRTMMYYLDNISMNGFFDWMMNVFADVFGFELLCGFGVVLNHDEWQ